MGSLRDLAARLRAQAVAAAPPPALPQPVDPWGLTDRDREAALARLAPSLPPGVTCPRCHTGRRWWWRVGRPGTLSCGDCIPPPKGEMLEWHTT
jgi:hypothetical protein